MPTTVWWLTLLSHPSRDRSVWMFAVHRQHKMSMSTHGSTSMPTALSSPTKDWAAEQLVKNLFTSPMVFDRSACLRFRVTLVRMCLLRSACDSARPEGLGQTESHRTVQFQWVKLKITTQRYEPIRIQIQVTTLT